MRIHLKRALFLILGFACFAVLSNINFYRTAVIWVSTQWIEEAPILNSETNWQSTAFYDNDSELLWPSEIFYDNDRIVNQLSFKSDLLNGTKKKILLYSGFASTDWKMGQTIFLNNRCRVNTCELTRNRSIAENADAILFNSNPAIPWTRRSVSQIWVLYLLESPYSTPGFERYRDVYNWTATYRHDSDIVAPYEKFIIHNLTRVNNTRNYAEGKTKKVAWFVSNCGPTNARGVYANQLSTYIDVDIYGQCGTMQCHKQNTTCSRMLKTDYKFYLSFENSNCRDYITEKFFVTGLQHDLIPIVMGAAPEDYVRVAPPHSFIHVDDFQSPEQLAQYLHKLDENDDLYNEYFRWKGTGRFINTFFWCRLCAMLHETSRESHSYRDLEKWWRGDGICIGRDSWRQRQRTSKFIATDYL